jgi:hypothetical protein
MRQFHLAYQDLAIVQSPTAQLQIDESQTHTIWQSTTAKLETPELEAFFGISFTHHILLLNKCRNREERLFYILQAASQFWSVSVMEHNINAGLYDKQGKLPNNFKDTLPKEVSPSAKEIFKRGKFQPAYAGKLNFYLNVLDEKIRLPHENPSIGIILCKEKNNTVVEFSVKTMNNPMGVSASGIVPDCPYIIFRLIADIPGFGFTTMNSHSR